VKIQELLGLYSQNEKVNAIASKLNSIKATKLFAKGLVGSIDAILAACIYHFNYRTQVFIFNNVDDAKYFFADLESLLEGKTILYFPASYRREYQVDLLENNLVLERAETLNRLNQKTGKGELIVTTIDAITEMVINEVELTQNTFEVKVGANFDMEFFIDFLTEHHFERSDFVYEAGHFSIRGGIIDVFSFSNDMPYRVELFGDEIESIRIFNPIDQLSVKKVDWFYIIPNVQKMVEQQRQSFFDYLPENSIFFTDDIKLSTELLENGLEKAEKSLVRKNENEADVKNPKEPATIEDLFINTTQFFDYLNKYSCVEIGVRNGFKSDEIVEFNCSPQPTFHKNFKLLIENLKQNQKDKLKNLIFSDTSKQIERLYTIFNDLDNTIEFEPIYHGLAQGFIDHEMKLACYTEHQVFDRFYRGKTKTRYNNSKIITLKELRELKPGDFVVHVDHGIGKFAGLEKIDVNGRMQEAVRLIYKNDDLLYVSINSLHKITKFSGKEGTEPRLNKLGSDTWEKLKTATKKKVKDIARDLIKLYAKRKAQSGFQFNEDTYLQVELEASFMYEDTPDQAKATADVKKDMESPHPMDRLVCGDVGFGKTEIAMRAAFKAVADSKQVAILVPTTILANQHYRSFKERFKDFPCTVDYINRFKTPKEQKEILKRAEEGKIDVLIGTHKLLSKDMKFKNLGLMIIDEEQKFGVAAKEKLKSIKVNVDTLTLTATPIPRTLNFSLMGARDLSIINTPPPNRQPVNTELHSYNDELLRDAVMHEIERDGQVFVVHHRVKDIYDIANRIQFLCPGVKVCVAHGQMEGDVLEDVMMRFIEGEYDVLVATTIIESGLDISNANTIIINNAQMFGLSDLHQMRGRVGRNNKKAYCYLLVPSIPTLSIDARRRLHAIEEFSDLGSGFNVAMRDLDIRGSGNLLGGEQSGFISEIGFEMYHKILDEAIQELKEDEFSEVFTDDKKVNSNGQMPETKSYLSKDCVVETDFEALIPDAYVRNIGERLSLYNSLASLTNLDDLQKFANDLVDRFGPIPQQVNDLIDLIKLRESAKKLGFVKIVLKNNLLFATFPNENNTAYYQSNLFTSMLQFIQHNGNLCKLKQSSKVLQVIFSNINSIDKGQDVFDKIQQHYHKITNT
jgi:transcription-repair coupling factor (superfamily II helicase)